MYSQQVAFAFEEFYYKYLYLVNFNLFSNHIQLVTYSKLKNYNTIFIDRHTFLLSPCVIFIYLSYQPQTLKCSIHHN